MTRPTPLPRRLVADRLEQPADAVAARIEGSLDPADDVHASGDYRRRLVRVLTARALREAYARATGAVA